MGFNMRKKVVSILFLNLFFCKQNDNCFVPLRGTSKINNLFKKFFSLDF